MSLTTVAVGAPGIASAIFNTNDWNTLNTGVAANTNSAFEIYMEGVPRTSVGYEEVNSATGGVGLRRRPVKGTESFNGDFSTPFNYSGLQRLFASLFGAEAVAATGSGYAHTLTFAKNPVNYLSFAYSDELAVHDAHHTKIQSWSCEWEEGSIGDCSWGLVGKRELTDGSGINGSLATFIAAATLPTQPANRYLMLNDAVLQIADASGTLAAEVNVNAISLSITRSFKEYRTIGTLPYIGDPIYGNWIEIEGRLGFPFWDTQADWETIKDADEKKMDLIFTGTTIGGGADWTYDFEIPGFQIMSDDLPNFDTEDLIELGMPFKAHFAAATPSGMTGQLPQLVITDTTVQTHLTNGA